jgi:AAA15 family ATPase/GTPase
MLLGEHLNSSQLKSFSIDGLFGFKDIKIPFEKEAVILIAENGSGKTTILNALYYSIYCKFDKLSAIDFNSIVLEFASGVSVEIKKSDLDSFYQSDIFELLAFLRPFLPSREIDILRREIRKNPSSEGVRRRLVELTNRYSLPPSKYSDILDEIDLSLRSDKRIDQKGKIDKITKTIKDNLNESILYFPTYRRIEEDLKSLGYDEERAERLSLGEGEGKLIQFGMDEVIGKFKEITASIKNSALNLFSKVTGEILTQFVEGIEVTQEMRDSIKPDTLNIVLSRVGEKNISKIDRQRIEELVSSGDINQPEHQQLVYFLSKLVGLYEQQKAKDDSINQLAKICNGYLNKKRIMYDEANVIVQLILRIYLRVKSKLYLSSLKFI